MVAMSMCAYEIAAAATADAMSTVYECGNLDHQHPLAMRLINSIFMEIVCAVEEYQEDIEDA